MAKYHLDHPTQSVACGAAAHGLPAVIFKTKDPDQCCETCKKVLAAMEAGRPVYSGYEDPDAQDRGARVVPRQPGSVGTPPDPLTRGASPRERGRAQDGLVAPEPGGSIPAHPAGGGGESAPFWSSWRLRRRFREQISASVEGLNMDSHAP